jgi:3-hydroxybutyryl-CoA dehydrogenase
VQDVSPIQPDDDAEGQLRERTDKLVKSGKLAAEQAEGALERLDFGTDLDAVAPSADFVLEGHRTAGNQESYLCPAGPARPTHVILATNSSTIGSSAVAAASGRPGQVCNMHFFNSGAGYEMRGSGQARPNVPETVETTLELARSLGKAPVLISREVPVFVANRLMGAAQKETLALLAGGVASREDIDATAKTALRLRRDHLSWWTRLTRDPLSAL